MSDSQISSIDDQPVEKTVVKKATKAQLKDAGISGNKRIITIHPSGDDAGEEAVPVGVNGVVYQIPRGEPFEVPEEVVHALQNAVVTTYKTDGNGKAKETSMPRYAISVS